MFFGHKFSDTTEDGFYSFLNHQGSSSLDQELNQNQITNSAIRVSVAINIGKVRGIMKITFI